MGITNYFAKAILKHVLGIESLARGVYLGVGTASPNASDEDSWSAEISGNGYARQRMPFSDASGHEASNSTDVWLPEATANWGSISHYGIWTARTGGKLLAYAAFTVSGSASPVTINAGDVLRVKPAKLVMTYAAATGLMSYYLEDHLLNHVFGNVAWSLPTVYVALMTSAPTPGDTGSQLAEPSGGNYARKQWSGTGGWNDPSISGSNAQSTNKSNLDFNEASASWGSIGQAALTDASSGGNWLLAGGFTPSISIGSGQQPRYATDQLTAQWGTP
jgi:hypothetical protein